MTSVKTDLSRASRLTQKVYDNVTEKSSLSVYKLQTTGLTDDLNVESIWTYFGLYISRQLRVGRAIKVPKFGTFTYTTPAVTLEGVTNPNDRDKQPRQPVFLLSKQFVNGAGIKRGIFGEFGHIRAYSVSFQNGKIQEVLVNYAEIAKMVGISKDAVAIGIERIVAHMMEKVRMEQKCVMEIPSIGTFVVRNGVAAVNFNEFLKNDVKTILSQSLYDRMKKKHSRLTAENLRTLPNPNEEVGLNEEEGINVDETGKQWLKANLKIDADTIFSNAKLRRSENFKRFSSDKKDNLSSSEILSKASSNLLYESASQNGYRPHSEVGDQNESAKKKKNYPLHEVALRKLKYFLRKRIISAEDAFVEIAGLIAGVKDLNPRLKIDRTKLLSAFQTLKYDISTYEFEALFRFIDKENTSFITFKGWMEALTDSEDLLHEIRRIIKDNNLLIDDVLKTMGVTRDQSGIKLAQLNKAIKQLSPYFDEEKCTKVSKLIMGNNTEIDGDRLIYALEINEQNKEVSQFDHSWFNSILKQISIEISKNPEENRLKREFEKYDTHNEGVLDVANFKAVLMKMKFNLTIEDVNRITRYIDTERVMSIDYIQFLRRLERIQRYVEDSSGVTGFARVLGNYIKNNNFTVLGLIKHLNKMRKETAQGKFDESNKLKNSVFSKLINKLVFPMKTADEVAKQAVLIDIDGDGYIDVYDLDIFLKRNQYIDEGLHDFHPESKPESNNSKSRKEQQRTISMESLSQKQEMSKTVTKKLFPTNPLTEEKIDYVLSDFRKALNEKKLTFFDAYKYLDDNNDGFVTINEFCEGIDKIFKISHHVKEGLFAYMDFMKIGMIDFPRFMTVMRKSPNQKIAETTDDNWNWQIARIKEIKEWMKNKSYSADIGFRMIDMDFDGFISQGDLRKFLNDILKIPADDLTSTRLDRLIKLMDFYKRGVIQVNDFRKVIEEPSEDGIVSNLKGIKKGFSPYSSNSSHLFDWKINARQQMGLAISKTFPNMRSAFDAISGHSPRILFHQFEKWVEETSALIGFNLTEKLLHQLFSDLDPHKKGFLTLQDLENSFGKFQWKKEIGKEIYETYITNFQTLPQAFEYLTKIRREQEALNVKEVNFTQFRAGTYDLVPGRFQKADLSEVWHSMVGNEKTVATIQEFTNYFDKFKTEKENNEIRVQPTNTNIKLPKSNSQVKSLTTSSFDETTAPKTNVFEFLKGLIQSSNKHNLGQVFEQFDQKKTGYISNLLFKNALRNLNIGLSSKQIDEVLLMSNNDDGMVNWKRFCERVNPSFSQNRILERSKMRLQRLAENIKYFLISPKDAFKQFNNNNTGKMTYDEFNNLVVTLCKLSGDQVPSFAIIKDLFDLIDIRGDGTLDIHEWMQSFRKIEELVLKTPSENEKIHIDATGTPLPHKSKHIAEQFKKMEWEGSLEYDQIINFFGRNRRTILERFRDEEKQGRVLNFENTISILQDIFKNASFQFDESKWELLLSFAMKRDVLDYELLIDVFRKRAKKNLDRPL